MSDALESTYQERAPWRSSEWFIICVVSLGLFTDTFNYGMIIPVIPKALVERADVSEEDAQSWINILLAVYGATVLLGSPIFGYFADYSKSRKVPFTLGLLALGSSTGLFMAGRSPAALVAARALQGFSAAAVWVIGMALLVDTVPQDRLGRAMGRTTVAMTWGSVLGPAIGGVTYERWGYYAAFYIPIGLIGLDIILRFLMIEPTAAKQIAPLPDNIPQRDPTASPSGLFNDMHAKPGSSGNPWSGSDEESPLITKSAISETTIKNNEKKENPGYVMARLLVSTTIWVPMLAAITVASIFAALEATIPLFVMKKFEWTTSGAGFAFLALSIPSCAADLIGRWVDRAGTRIPGSIAFFFSAVAITLLRFVQSNTIATQVLLIGLLFVVGVTIVLAQVSSMTQASQVVIVAESRRPGIFGDRIPTAQAYALLNMAVAGGQMCGPILGGSIKEYAGWNVMTLVLGLLCGLTSCVVVFCTGSQTVVEKADDSEAGSGSEEV